MQLSDLFRFIRGSAGIGEAVCLSTNDRSPQFVARSKGNSGNLEGNETGFRARTLIELTAENLCDEDLPVSGDRNADTCPQVEFLEDVLAMARAGHPFLNGALRDLIQ